MNDYTFVAFPGIDGAGVVVRTRGVMTDAKPAKVNAEKKLPTIKNNYEKELSKIVATVVSKAKDYTKILADLGMTAVNHAKTATNSGFKKIRTSSIVPENLRNAENTVVKIDVIPEKQVVVETPKEEVKVVPEVKPTLEPTIVNNQEEMYGKHAHTGEIKVEPIKEAVKNEEFKTPNNITPIFSRAERNSLVNDVKTETKAVDMDLYNNLVHNEQDDMSRQIQGINSEISKEKAETQKITEKAAEAYEYLEKLKEQYKNKEREKIEKINRYYDEKQAELETIKQEKLEQTNNLTSVLAQISQYEAKIKAFEDYDVDMFEESHSRSNAA